MAQWSQAAADGRNQKHVFIKSMLCISAFVVTWAPITVSIANGFWSYKEQYITNFFLPIQGILNALVYSNLFPTLKEGMVYMARRATMNSMMITTVTVMDIIPLRWCLKFSW